MWEGTCGFSNFSKQHILLYGRRGVSMEEYGVRFICRCGGMADTRDLKSLGGDIVPVQVWSPAPYGELAELADACDLGSYAFGVGVRLSYSPPFNLEM